MGVVERQMTKEGRLHYIPRTREYAFGEVQNGVDDLWFHAPSTRALPHCTVGVYSQRVSQYMS